MGSIKLLQPPKAMAYGSRPLAIFTIRDTKALTTITRCFPRFMSDLIIKPGNVLDRILPDCCRHTRFLYLHNITTQLCPVIKLLPGGINYIIISVYACWLYIVKSAINDNGVTQGIRLLCPPELCAENTSSTLSFHYT